ncbi:MAG: glycosyltransferase [Chloroflexota bacterium]|nr:glycosyltransferase [Chloroflexota bacterium]
MAGRAAPPRPQCCRWRGDLRPRPQPLPTTCDLDSTAEIGGLSIVVPVHSAERSLDELVRRACASAARLTEGLEIVLVDDGSTDARWTTIRDIAAANRAVPGARLMQNYGQVTARPAPAPVRPLRRSDSPVARADTSPWRWHRAASPR